MNAETPLVFVSAWNESGGGFMHRLLDGHPELFVYPFELQLGVNEDLGFFSEWFRAKYRWPHQKTDLSRLSAEEIFDAIIDDETKSTLIDPRTSKFSGFELNFDIAVWRAAFVTSLKGRTRTSVVTAYLTSFFHCWKERFTTGRERLFIAHCPVINLDACLIFSDFPSSRIVQVIRSPVAGFADMRRRRPEVDAIKFATKWNLVTSMAFAEAMKERNRFSLLRTDDLVRERESALRRFCDWLQIEYDSTVLSPSWNAKPLRQLYPFGGLLEISAEYEQSQCDAIEPETRALIEELTLGVRTMLEDHPHAFI